MSLRIRTKHCLNLAWLHKTPQFVSGPSASACRMQLGTYHTCPKSIDRILAVTPHTVVTVQVGEYDVVDAQRAISTGCLEFISYMANYPLLYTC